VRFTSSPSATSTEPWWTFGVIVSMRPRLSSSRSIFTRRVWLFANAVLKAALTGYTYVTSVRRISASSAS
jgi:hypothetical protein